MDYSTFKSLQILLFWGSAIAFCVWQLRAVQRMRQQRVVARDRVRPVSRPRARYQALSQRDRDCA
ncbi:hypothetical protein [uncultured Thiohalocapsa sp.]|uniref:hypothetical protein n=1 Tax=uncultured Thiohalocapsa sp. TaxID=768990 RepID=UPI0025F1BF2F|nr:hypothetical protein [uncultured Thiohalocapsa sp.]